MMRRWVVTIAAALLAGGCATSSTYLPLTVEVRDRLSHEPVAGALVHARSEHFFVPAPPYAIFDPRPPRSARGRTDEAGRVRLRVIADHPVQLVVVAKGYGPLVLPLERHPGRGHAAAGWQAADALTKTPDGEAALEVRCLP